MHCIVYMWVYEGVNALYGHGGLEENISASFLWDGVPHWTWNSLFWIERWPASPNPSTPIFPVTALQVCIVVPSPLYEHLPSEPSPEPPQQQFHSGKQCSDGTRQEVLHLGHIGLGSSHCCSFRRKVVEGDCDWWGGTKKASKVTLGFE